MSRARKRLYTLDRCVIMESAGRCPVKSSDTAHGVAEALSAKREQSPTECAHKVLTRAQKRGIVNNRTVPPVLINNPP